MNSEDFCVVIVPSHNQAKHIQDIVTAYEGQTVKPDLLLFVLDRCSDNSAQILLNIKSSLNLEFIEKQHGSNFSAGMTRDVGIEYIEKYDYDFVIFTDGDCIPNEFVVEEHIRNLKRTSKHAVSCGKRMYQLESGEWIDDGRNQMDVFTSNGRVHLNRFFVTHMIVTYSCNLAFNKAAIKICKDVNIKLKGGNRVFNSIFDGGWGGEDDFIGYCIYMTGGYIITCSNESMVHHYYHKTYDKDLTMKMCKLKDLYHRLSELISNGDVSGETVTYLSDFDKNMFDIETVQPEVFNIIYNYSGYIRNNEIEKIANILQNASIDMIYICFARNYVFIESEIDSKTFQLLEIKHEVDSLLKIEFTLNCDIINTI